MSITFKGVDFTYSPNTPFSFQALANVSVSITPQKITAIIGATGSGKSTFVQHLNGLLLPSAGEVTILDHRIVADEKPKNLKKLREKVGLVFQFPEMQLFEDTVYKDVSFGPRNFKFDDQKIKEQVESALKVVGIKEPLWEQSPLDLSGGQKRRVAIAGVLATNPEAVVLDEPTAGLDPQGSKKMLELFVDLKNNHGKTIVMVTHDMNQVLNYADEIIVLDHGSVAYTGAVNHFFADRMSVEKLGFVIPKVLHLKYLLHENGFKLNEFIDINSIAHSVSEELNHDE